MIDRDIKIFLLKLLLAAQGQPMTQTAITQAVNTAFSHVAIPPADLQQIIDDAKEQGLIDSANDEALGTIWGLTPKGKLRAQGLR